MHDALALRFGLVFAVLRDGRPNRRAGYREAPDQIQELTVTGSHLLRNRHDSWMHHCCSIAMESNVVFKANDTGMFCTCRTTINHIVVLDTVADDSAATMIASGSECVNRAFK